MEEKQYIVVESETFDYGYGPEVVSYIFEVLLSVSLL
jgi:hypothetical protein